MPPQRTRTRKSTLSTRSDLNVRPYTLPTKHGSPATTPRRSPAKRRVGLSRVQKQALIDNLQLEITERARKLRAQYALQAQGLRTRLEIRVHRIPVALRKAKIAEVLEKYSGKRIQSSEKTLDVRESFNDASQSPSAQQSRKRAAARVHNVLETDQPRTRGLKRSSDEAHIISDKENAPVINPKQRKRTVKTQSSARHASRLIRPSQVLSPKSNNSRLPPALSAPKLPTSPSKSNIARPISPNRPVPSKAPPKNGTVNGKMGVAKAPARIAKAPGAATMAMRTTRGAKSAYAMGHANLSIASDTSSSAGTTIVNRSETTRARPAQAAATSPAKKTGQWRKLAGKAGKPKETVIDSRGYEPVKTGRVLRNRG